MRWVRLTDSGTRRPLEGEELWSDNGLIFYGKYYYNGNVCSYVWNALHDKGKAHTREEAIEKLLSAAVNQRIKS